MIAAKPLLPSVSREKTLALWQARTDTDSFLRQLRAEGARQIECIMAIRELGGFTLGRAKEIVHFSAAWADMRASSEALHEVALAALEQLQHEDAVAEQIAS